MGPAAAECRKNPEKIWLAEELMALGVIVRWASNPTASLNIAFRYTAKNSLLYRNFA